MNDLITKTIRVTQDILSQEVSGETVFLDLNSENYFSLDSIGTRIWQLLQENGDLQKVCITMTEEYDVEKDQMEKDLSDLISELIKAEIVEVVQ